jgi:isocitrate dehydrogenase kinase/phosphatase
MVKYMVLDPPGTVRTFAQLRQHYATTVAASLAYTETPRDLVHEIVRVRRLTDPRDYRTVLLELFRQDPALKDAWARGTEKETAG